MDASVLPVAGLVLVALTFDYINGFHDSANSIATVVSTRVVEVAAYTAIAAGTLTGGWRITHTMGNKITKLTPMAGFAAETGAAVAIFTATQFGVGISTTHTITGAIVGVGAKRAGCRLCDGGWRVGSHGPGS